MAAHAQSLRKHSVGAGTRWRVCMLTHMRRKCARRCNSTRRCSSTRLVVAAQVNAPQRSASQGGPSARAEQAEGEMRMQNHACGPLRARNYVGGGSCGRAPCEQSICRVEEPARSSARAALERGKQRRDRTTHNTHSSSERKGAAARGRRGPPRWSSAFFFLEPGFWERPENNKHESPGGTLSGHSNRC